MAKLQELARRARLQDFHRRKFLAFEEFQERAASSRNVADVVGDAVFVNGGDGIAAARNGEPLGGSDGERKGPRYAPLRPAGLRLEGFVSRWYKSRYIPLERSLRMQTAKLFKNGRSQAVRLPAEFRFEGDEVLIRRDPVTGDVILSSRNKKFEEWLKLRDKLIAEAPKEFEDFEIPRDPGPPIERDWP